MPQNNTRKERRQAAREERKIEMAQRMKKQRRKKVQGWLFGSIVAVVAIGIVALGWLLQPRPAEQTYPENMLNDAVTLGQNFKVLETAALKEGEEPTPLTLLPDRVEVEVYLDYLCPYCKAFDLTQKPLIEKYLKEKDVVFSFHPLGFLSVYSGVAANASACIASKEPNAWWKANGLLYENQPDEATAKGFNESRSVTYIKDTLQTLNLKEPTLKCITEMPHMKWAAEATNRAIQGPIPNSNLTTIAGTPTVLVDGVKLDFDFSVDTINFDIALSNALNNARANK